MTRHRGPAERKLDAYRQQARLENDLATLDALDDALNASRRQALNLHATSTRETVAGDAVQLFEAWRAATADLRGETPEQGSMRRHPSAGGAE